ncbi:unnamed protein product [Rotaria sp. Silwood1]|nr:unnamed protein product [Rotaria sp. Silwood1]
MVFQSPYYSSFGAPTSSCPGCAFSQGSMVSQPLFYPQPTAGYQSLSNTILKSKNNTNAEQLEGAFVNWRSSIRETIRVSSLLWDVNPDCSSV